MNTMFGLNGIGGMLLATVLLLSIIGFLGTNAVLAQQKTANDPYVITGNSVAQPKTKEDVYANLQEVDMIDNEARHRIADAK